MTQFLVLSYRHGLTHLAWRLQREGHEVDSIAFRPRFEKAFGGALQGSVHGPDRPQRVADLKAHMEPLVERAKAGSLVVLHDHERWHDLFAEAVHLYPTFEPTGEATQVRLGGWFDGQHVTCPHLLVEDWGAWAGGFGPEVPSALTLVRPDRWPDPFKDALDSLEDELKSRGCRGLVSLSARLGPDGTLERKGWESGWSTLHSHAWLAALGTQGMGLGDVLGGGEPVLAHRFSIVAPVTTPPWPIECNVASRQVEFQASPEVQRNLFLHDVRVDQGARKLYVAGLDGFVAVARGCGEVWDLAVQRLHQVVQGVVLPEKQWRPDSGAGVMPVLCSLEAAGLGVL